MVWSIVEALRVSLNVSLPIITRMENFQKCILKDVNISERRKNKSVPLKDIFLMTVGLRKPVQVAEIADSLTRGHSYLTIVCT